MLNILFGRAGTGKTARIMSEIGERAERGEAGMLLIVPEQYSHYAERQLCEVCGDSLSLHAEVLSFTRLCSHVLAETGGAARRILDKGGQLLLMHKVLEQTAPYLKVFGVRKMRMGLLESLLASVKEFRSMCLTAQRLEELSNETVSPLREKLRDFAVILDAYDALLETYGCDTAERLALLCEKIQECDSIGKGHIYFDGFNDFTAQELQIIKELLKKGADITVCITCLIDGDALADGYAEVFELPRRTIAQLQHLDKDAALICADDLKDAAASRPRTVCPELAYLERHLFNDSSPAYNPPPSSVSDFTHNPASSEDSLLALQPVSIFAAPSRYAECQYTAAVIWEMVRKHGCRWRDIGLVARDFSQYEAMCGQVFEKYGIPYFSGGKEDIRNKAPVALIDAALDIATMGFEYKTVFRYLKTGLLGLSIDEISTLENYVIMWNIRGSEWLREWTMPPSGYKTGHRRERDDEQDKQMLDALNELRHFIITPLVRLKEKIKGETRTEDKLSALYDFMVEISLPEMLVKKSNEFRVRGQLRQSDEYSQLLDITIDALDCMHTIMGESLIADTEFRKLMSMVLTQYEVGVIPVSLDRVSTGSMTMSRRRDLKCLIILGATDESLPNLSSDISVLSDNERRVLSEIESSIPAGFDERLYREMNMIYSTLTLPSDFLIMVYETAGGGKPSFIIRRMREMFQLDETVLKELQYLGCAREPYNEFLELKNKGSMTAQRSQLTPTAAEQLFGNEISVSASRVDGYFSCAYRHFLQNGLKLAPRKVAQFDAASAGIFMHSVLDGVLFDIAGGSGFANVTDAELKELTVKHSEKFVHDVLLDFAGKNERFEYLFRRYEQDVLFVARDLVDELRHSEFRPVQFELDISKLDKAQRGFIDRVDTYETGGELYLRVIDYKTRKKAYQFCLSDVLHGRDMQMLIYLLALKKHGGSLFGKEIKPAGVLYVPARDVIVAASRGSDDDEISKLRQKERRRSGLVLSAEVIIDAMESGEKKRFLPVKIGKDKISSGDSIASSTQITTLLTHVERKMQEAKNGILSGKNQCRPYYKDSKDTACVFCDYSPVCRFDEQLGDRYNYIRSMEVGEVWEELDALHT